MKRPVATATADVVLWGNVFAISDIACMDGVLSFHLEFEIKSGAKRRKQFRWWNIFSNVLEKWKVRRYYTNHWAIVRYDFLPKLRTLILILTTQASNLIKAYKIYGYRKGENPSFIFCIWESLAWNKVHSV